MTLALNYEAQFTERSTGTRPGLVPAIIALAIANLNFPFLGIWAYLDMPPFHGSISGPGDLFAVLFIGAWPVLSILLALWGLVRCIWHSRRLATLLMGSFALTLDGFFALLLLRLILP